MRPRRKRGFYMKWWYAVVANITFKMHITLNQTSHPRCCPYHYRALITHPRWALCHYLRGLLQEESVSTSLPFHDTRSSCWGYAFFMLGYEASASTSLFHDTLSRCRTLSLTSFLRIQDAGLFSVAITSLSCYAFKMLNSL
jgi:hypothetical protein